MSANSLQILKQVADSFAYFREFVKSGGKMLTSKPSNTILDAVLAIFIEE